MRFVLPLAALALVAQTALAQTPVAQTRTELTLDEAINLARHNNPTLQQTINARRMADAQVRTAYATLLPSVSAQLGGRYQKAGQQFVSGIGLSNSSDVMQSWYGLGVDYRINSDVLFGPRVVRANRAAEADVIGATELLRATVTQQYLTVLQAQARAALQDTLVLTTKGQLDLAKARQAVDAGTILDVRRAEVAAGQSEVATLQAHNTAEVEMLRLFQQLGVAQPSDVVLTTKFAITPVTFELDSLKELARIANPGLAALRSRERSAGVQVSGVRGRYAPTLELSTGWGGNSSRLADESVLLQRATGGFLADRSSCFFEDSLRSAVAGMSRLNCNALVFTGADTARLLSQNSKFPFKFDRAPMSFSAFISMPIFDNLNREQRLQQALIARDDAKYSVKRGELQLVADVTNAFLNLKTALRTTQLQEINAQRAREELAFAEERYRVGAATFLDVTTSRGTFEQAQIDRLNAIYDYHRAFAALENAVGRPSAEAEDQK